MGWRETGKGLPEEWEGSRDGRTQAQRSANLADIHLVGSQMQDKAQPHSDG